MVLVFVAEMLAHPLNEPATRGLLPRVITEHAELGRPEVVRALQLFRRGRAASPSVNNSRA
jgi:hypothetical protein